MPVAHDRDERERIQGFEEQGTPRIHRLLRSREEDLQFVLEMQADSSDAFSVIQSAKLMEIGSLQVKVLKKITLFPLNVVSHLSMHEIRRIPFHLKK